MSWQFHHTTNSSPAPESGLNPLTSHPCLLGNLLAFLLNGFGADRCSRRQTPTPPGETLDVISRPRIVFEGQITPPRCHEPHPRIDDTPSMVHLFCTLYSRPGPCRPAPCLD